MNQKIYNLCNKYGYYTCGNNADYANLFELTDISAIAYDIFTHSSNVFDYESILQTVKKALN